MNKHYDNYLCKTYKSLYKNRYKSMQETCMCWGFDHGDGWFKIILALSEALSLISYCHKVDITIDQVKEKFGTLRFYYHFNSEARIPNSVIKVIDTLVDIAEHATQHICEICGNFGGIQPGSWVMVRCEDCMKKRELEHGKT